MTLKRIINDKPKVGDVSQYNFDNSETIFDYKNSTGLPKNNDKFQNKDLFTKCVGDELNNAIIERNLKFQGDPYIKIENLYISNAGVDGTVKNNHVAGWIFSQEAYGGDPTKDGYSTVKSKMTDEWKFYSEGFGSKGEGTDIGNITGVEGTPIVSNFGVEASQITLGDFTGKTMDFNNSNGLDAFELSNLEPSPSQTTIFNEQQYNPIYIVIYTRGDKKVAWPVNTDSRKKKYSIFKISSDELFEKIGTNYVGTVYQNNFTSPTKTRSGEGGGGAQASAWKITSLQISINTTAGVKNNFSDVGNYQQFIPLVLPKTKITENSFNSIEWLASTNPKLQLDNTEDAGNNDSLDRHPDFIPFTSFGFSQNNALATSYVDLQDYNYDVASIMKASSPLNVTFNLSIRDLEGNSLSPLSYITFTGDDINPYVLLRDEPEAQELISNYDEQLASNSDYNPPPFFNSYDFVVERVAQILISKNIQYENMQFYNIEQSGIPFAVSYNTDLNKWVGGNPNPHGTIASMTFSYIPEEETTDNPRVYYYFIIDWNDEDDKFKTIEDWSDSKPENNFDYLERQNENLYKIYSTKDANTPNNVYTSPGIKNIKFIMFSVFDDVNFEVGRWKLCTSRIYLDIPPNQYPDFGDVGGSDYTTLPWPFTTPIIGGVSEDSKYKKSIENTLGGGKVGEFDIVDEKFLLDDLENDEMGKNIETMDLEQCRYFNGSYDMNRLLNISTTEFYTDISGSSTQTTGYWDGDINKFSEESSVGQIFIGDNSDLDLKQSCKLELNTGNITNKSILDTSGNSNKGLLIGDYKVKKVKKGQSMRRDSFIKVPKKVSNKNGAL